MYTIRAKKFEAFKGDATNENVANVANEKKGHEAKYEPSEWEIIFTKYIIASRFIRNAKFCKSAKAFAHFIIEKLKSACETV